MDILLEYILSIHHRRVPRAHLHQTGSSLFLTWCSPWWNEKLNSLNCSLTRIGQTLNWMWYWMIRIAHNCTALANCITLSWLQENTWKHNIRPGPWTAPKTEAERRKRRAQAQDLDWCTGDGDETWWHISFWLLHSHFVGDPQVITSQNLHRLTKHLRELMLGIGMLDKWMRRNLHKALHNLQCTIYNVQRSWAFHLFAKTICHSPEELGVNRMEQAIASTQRKPPSEKEAAQRYKLFSIGPPQAVSQPAASEKLLLLLVAEDLAAGKISWHLGVCEDIHISWACLAFLEVVCQLIKLSCFLKSRGYNKPCSSLSYSSKKTQDPFSTTVCMVRSSPCVAI